MFYSRVWWCGVAIVWFFMLFGTDGQITYPAEVTALQSIKKSLIDPNRNLSNWNKGDPCNSNWTGVLCFNTIMKDGYLHVRELQLLNMDLSGTLSPELGRLSYMQILDVMWNKISGSIPKEIGNITTLELLLLNGNQLTGSLPEEIGFLPNLDRIQIDQNQISGPLPKTFANLNKTKHFHMNNNSISGQIPPELSRLPSLVHMLLDNNNLSGYLPPELASLPSLLILGVYHNQLRIWENGCHFLANINASLSLINLQLDNNNFDGGTIPDTYGNMSHLLKLSLRNCGLQGPIPDLSRIQNLSYIDLSSNHLNGTIPTHQLSTDITTIDLSNNNLSGTVPSNFSRLPRLQRLSLEDNFLSGSVESSIWLNRPSNDAERLIVDLQNNRLTNISGSTNLPPNVTVRLEGNPICSTTHLDQFCVSQNESLIIKLSLTNSEVNCPVQACPPPYEYSPKSPVPCFCAAPLLAGYRLKSPGFSDFLPYVDTFDSYLTSGLQLNLYQLDLDNFIWEEGPRLKMNLKFFPVYIDNTSYLFNKSEVLRIRSMFTGWKIPDSDLFGPYELINFTLWGPYRDVIPSSSNSGISKGALAGIVLGTVAGAVVLSTLVSLFIARLYAKKRREISKRRKSSKMSIKIDGVKGFAFEEMSMATSNFDVSSQVGQGGYGKVYRGILADGTTVAIKRAQEGSLQGEKEFLTEIELLSRLHHRNLVSLLGYCEDEGEQMLIYEYMSNGTIREHLTGKSKEPLSFAMRLRIAIGSAKGILYLHAEADPPIFHRDIKATNILLDSNYNAKVADFGLSRLAPVPDIEGIIPAHVSTVVKGTPGYLDPEYFLTHKLTDKSDVYSLGVVFLELLTGLRPISHGKNLVREVNTAYGTGNIYSVIDDKMGAYPSECVEKFVSLALKCCRDETDSRPSMAEVVRELEIIYSMMPDSDTKKGRGSSAPMDSGKTFTPSSSSSQMKNPYLSLDISGSELVSGVVPSISPR